MCGQKRSVLRINSIDSVLRWPFVFIHDIDCIIAGMKERHILWADAEHIGIWASSFVFLSRNGYAITLLTSLADESVLKGCVGKDALVLHCGTHNPMAGMKPLLTDVKQQFSNILIGLETNVKHPAVEELVDFYITKPIRPSRLLLLLNSAIRAEE